MSIKRKFYGLSQALLAASFVLLSSCEKEQPEPIIPIVTVGNTVGLSKGTHAWLTMNATVVYEGLSPILSHGVVYSKDANPTIETATVADLGELNFKIFGYAFDNSSKISPDRVYFAKAYVKVDDKVYYSNEVQFRTLTGSWRQRASFTGPHRKSSLSFSVDGNVYLLGGSTLEAIKLNDVWCYNTANDTWSQKSTFPLASITAEDAAVFVIENFAYVVSASGLWKYNSSEDSWVKLGNGLNQTKMTAFSIGNKGYAGNGRPNGALNIYDPGLNSWTAIPRTQATLYPGKATWLKYTLAANGKAYTGLGLSAFNPQVDDPELEFFEFDPVARTWTKKNTFTSDPRTGLICFVIGDKIFMGMGRNSYNAVLADIYYYDLITGWKDVASMPGVERADAISFATSEKGYIGLGFKYYAGGRIDKLTDFWEFTP